MGRKHWQYCDKCSKAVVYEPDPFEMPEKIWKELEIRMYEHREHLCVSCEKQFATCDGKPEFGNCVGSDNVVCCQNYVEQRKESLERLRG